MNATVLLKSVDIAIPGYKILRPIGEGGMASVFLAIQESLDREVALKVMSPALAANSEFAQRFLIEGKITAKLQHPNLVTVYDIGTHAGVYYLAAEYIPAGTLKERIAEGGLSVAEILDISTDIAQGLDFAHQKGFVHRDVKPGNVLFRNDGRVVLADFGIAKAMDGSNSSTVAGMSVGTPDYMSPEQARGEPVDGRSDLYSLGVVLFEMLTGSAPYQASDPFTVALMHVTHPVPELPEPFVWLQPLIAGLMAKNSAERVNSGAAYVSAVHQLVANAPEGATLQAVGTHRPRGERLSGSAATQQRTRISATDAKSGRPVWVLPAIGAAVLLGGGIGAWALLSPSEPVVDAANLPTAAVTAVAPATQSGEQGPSPQINVPTPVDAPQQQMQFWLEQARTYKDYGLNDKTDPGRRLFFPQDDNALDLYLQVLQMDPQNAEAQQGLTEIAGWVYDRAFRLCHEMNRWVACRLLAENGLRAQPSHEGLRELVDDAQRGERGETVRLRSKR